MRGSYLDVQALTWEKATHGLFDYEAKQIQKSNFKVNSTCLLCRQNSDCYITTEEKKEESTPLIKFEQRSSDFQVQLMAEEASEKMWLVVKGIKGKNSNGYKLNEGDWIKLGRVRLRVQKISLHPETLSRSSMPDFFNHFDNEEVDYKQETSNAGETTDSAPCRICLSESSSPDDPLICPCKCAGTMKYVHLNCLKEWIKSKLNSRVTEKGMSVYMKDLSCELCNSSLPSFVHYQNQQISLISLNYPSKSFIMLEEFRPEKMQKQGLHVISLDDGQSGNLGRGHDCDIKISDISVSRKHCKVKFCGNEFYLEDTKSKFGTLIKLSNSINIKDNTDITIQVSRTVIHIVHKQPWSFKNKCCCKSNKVAIDEISCFTQSEFANNYNEGLSNRVTINLPIREIQHIDSVIEENPEEELC
ncbi:hypothetical protein SteCoe_10849 [Stentor coeruleus]|uniref:RING-CH-type domain-containing protein n=1 Tax=Stentor coeruleus TaxID=5963 RepID=A0A1R2CEJ5_9CILI|nr:hypothetical protein SteCoe_10849 [Stentor coeruleus]